MLLAYLSIAVMCIGRGGFVASMLVSIVEYEAGCAALLALIVFCLSGCTSHFLGTNAHCTNKQSCAQGVIIKLANNMTMKATHTALLDHPNIPIEARQCHIFPDMGSKALLSIAQFVDHGYRAVLKPTSISLIHETNPDLSFKGG